MSFKSIITGIWTRAVTDWKEAVTWVDDKVAAIEKAWPGSTAAIAGVVSDIKRGASDAIGAADTALSTVAPEMTTALEGAADAALVKYTGGLALPLVGLTNDAINKIEQVGVATLNGWALNARATLAGNNGDAVAQNTSGAGAAPAGQPPLN